MVSRNAPYLGRNAARDHAEAIERSRALHAAPLHRHVHRFIEGERSFTHAHPGPLGEHDKLATRPHRHINGQHSHPHGHADYPADPS